MGMDDESSIASADADSEIGINASTQGNTTQGSTQFDSTENFQTPTVTARRRGRPSRNDSTASSRTRTSSASSSTRTSVRRRLMSGDTQLSTPSTASLL